jgi:Ca2+-binding EF-hand superfamily protein
MGCRNSVPSEAALIDEDNDGLISKEEVSKFIEKNAKLWAMLSVNLNLPEKKCREIATQVAYQLAKKRKCKSLKDMDFSEKERKPTVKEFQAFLDHLKDPKGEQEFFHRTVFAVYDQDQNGYLDPNELSKFLDVFYEADSIFAGDARLPAKAELKATALKNLDKNGDGKLDFQEMRSLISGGAGSLTR